jgi:hypothetical protein
MKKTSLFLVVALVAVMAFTVMSCAFLEAFAQLASYQADPVVGSWTYTQQPGRSIISTTVIFYDGGTGYLVVEIDDKYAQMMDIEWNYDPNTNEVTYLIAGNTGRGTSGTYDSDANAITFNADTGPLIYNRSDFVIDPVQATAALAASAPAAPAPAASAPPAQQAPAPAAYEPTPPNVVIPSSFTFTLLHSRYNPASAQKPVIFWFNGDRSQSVTVPFGESRTYTVRFQPGQVILRMDAEFADGSGGHVFSEEDLRWWEWEWGPRERRYYNLAEWGMGLMSDDN